MTRGERTLRAMLATVIVSGLGALGGVLGGVFVALTFVTHGILDPASRAQIDRSDIEFITYMSVLFGATFGVVLGPLFGWTLLRRAPLGGAIGETALAAAIGVGLSQLVPWGYALFLFPILSSTAAALRLRAEMARRSSEPSVPSVAS